MSDKRKCCEECPWKTKNKHNSSLIDTIKSFVLRGLSKNTEHRCHMISSDLWAPTNDENVCIGSKIKNQ